MNENRPIGIFDSGVGGLSIWMEINQLLPKEDTLYLADSKNAPYGYKTAEEITALSIKNTEFLIEEGCKIIVVACNTATTNAISVLRANYRIPIIGIEPAIKPAAMQSQSKSIGILATKGTLSSGLFHKTSGEFTKDIRLLEIVGEGLVPLIEAGKLDSPELIDLLKIYADQLIEAKVDYIVLGCTHYPFIVPQLKKLMPSHVKIIDSGLAVAKQTKFILEQNKLLKSEIGTHMSPTHRFFTNANTATMKMLLGEYLDKISVENRNF